MDTANEAVYCRPCATIIPVDTEDLFLGEIYCPTCLSRTGTSDGHTVKSLRKLYPKASLLQLDLAGATL